MPPKKGKDKQAGFTEVEKTFLELELVDCNKKLARLRTTLEEYEQRNEELQKSYNNLDEERADIIAYLKKSLETKNDENNELKEALKVLEESRNTQTVKFKDTVADLERSFMIMKDQLTSENKLLTGKLNTLEEFRAIRDDLMQKFEKQEQVFMNQEMKYKRIIYDAEKKFVIGKDKLKKEMEASLLKLAQDFQDSTELRIAASTHRVIRENIAVNYELDNVLTTQSLLTEQNEKYKQLERNSFISMQLAEEERDKAISKSAVQQKVINQLTKAFQNLNTEKALFNKRNYDFDVLLVKVQKLTKDNENLSLQVRILEQNLHSKMTDQNKAGIEYSKMMKENTRLKKILQEAAKAVQAALKLDLWSISDTTHAIIGRDVILSQLLSIITQHHDVEKSDSADTLASFGKIYEKGDLGFLIPKPISKKSMGSTAYLPSKQSISGEKESLPSSAISTSSIGSVRTIPSIKLLPASNEQDVTVRDSTSSVITSTRTSGSSETDTREDEDMDDIERQLVRSKLEVQKSIMKDLAYSQMALNSQLKFSTENHKPLLSESTSSVRKTNEKEDESKTGDEKTQGSSHQVGKGNDVDTDTRRTSGGND